MSKLEKLIEELCPEGVELVKLSEVVDYDQPTKYIVKSTEYDPKFETPVLTAGKSFILGYTNEKTGIYNADSKNPVIIFDDFTTSLHWIDFQFKIKSSAMKILKNKDIEKSIFRYLFYVMKNIKYTPGEHGRQWIGKYSQLKIPLPPLPVQREIVRILDNFTELTAELTAELIARKKQYDYYQKLLFNFHNTNVWKTLGDIAECFAGATPKTNVNSYWKNGIIPWMSSGEVNSKKIYSTEKKISQEGYDSSSTKIVPKKTVVMALAGQGKTRGKVAITEIELCTNQSLCSIIPNSSVNSYYLYYYLETQYLKLRDISSGDRTRGGLNLKMIKNYPIPVPSLEEQKYIVKILDRFDTMCNDISSGLPAEIKMREEQYVHYREKIFKLLEG